MNLSSVDFARRGANMTGPGWVLLVGGGLALAFALWKQHEWSVQAERREEARAVAIERERAARRPLVPVLPTLSERRWQGARMELGYPWLRVLRSVEDSTHDPVYLKSLVVDRGTAGIRIEAEAPSFDRALEYVQMIDADGVLAPAFLASHEPIVDAFGNPAVRFSLATQWSGK